jgi:excisionase family DNA binding protein
MKAKTIEKEFLSIQETCKLLGISRRTVYRMFDRGEIKKGKAGTRTLIKRSEIDKLFT